MGVLLDFDLTSRVVLHTMSAVEPLRWMLRDPRALRITRQSDNLWARILDLQACLSPRRFSRSGSVALAVTDTMLPANEGTWRIDVGDDLRATVTATDDDPDLAMDIAPLSGLFLGGNNAQELADAGLITESRTGAQELLSQLLRVDPPPHNSFAF